MMNKNKIIIFLWGLVMGMLVWNCSSPTAVTGGGSDTEVGGTVAGLTGNKIPHVEVKLIPDSYNPVEDQDIDPILVDTTDEDGRYVFRQVDSGTYNITAHFSQDNSRMMVTRVQVLDLDVAVAEETLRHPGSVMIPLPDGANSDGGYVYIPGTELYVEIDLKADSLGYLTLDQVPAAVLPDLKYADKQISDAPVKVGEDIKVPAGGSVSLPPYFEWKHSKRVFLNTTPAGADVSGNVTDFPVLIQLNNSNFTFSEAHDKGGDFRVAKANGVALKYHIERWADGQGQAEIWVQVDTVYGGNNDQLIHLYWGNPSAVDKSDSYRVFDTEKGFAAVWHLGEEAPGTGTAGVHRNAAADRDHADDWATSADKGGLIAGGHYFDQGDYLSVNNASAALRPSAGFTLSAWVKIDTTDSAGVQIMSMGDDYGLRVYPGGNGGLYLYDDNTSNFVVRSANTNVLDKSWHLLAGVFTGAEMLIYIDGQLKNTVVHTDPVLYNIGQDFMIGTHGNRLPLYDYTGYLDELRVSSVPRSADWLKLGFENQKPDQALVEFR